VELLLRRDLAGGSATPGSARTRSSIETGIVAWVPVVEPLTSSFSKIAASVVAVVASARSSPDCCVESVRMNVPATIDTPMTIAKAVSSARSLRPAIPLRTTAIIDRGSA
jgi:hypothetical protein